MLPSSDKSKRTTRHSSPKATPKAKSNSESEAEDDKADVLPQQKQKRMIKELEVHEGVDMYKEKFSEDDLVKEKGQKKLRACPKQVETMNMAEPAVRKKPKTSAVPKKTEQGPAPRPRGRAPNGKLHP